VLYDVAFGEGGMPTRCHNSNGAGPQRLVKRLLPVGKSWSHGRIDGHVLVSDQEFTFGWIVDRRFDDLELRCDR
jgi:hypothetical protein